MWLLKVSVGLFLDLQLIQNAHQTYSSSLYLEIKCRQSPFSWKHRSSIPHLKRSGPEVFSDLGVFAQAFPCWTSLISKSRVWNFAVMSVFTEVPISEFGECSVQIWVFTSILQGVLPYSCHRIAHQSEMETGKDSESRKGIISLGSTCFFQLNFHNVTLISCIFRPAVWLGCCRYWCCWRRWRRWRWWCWRRSHRSRRDPEHCWPWRGVPAPDLHIIHPQADAPGLLVGA